MKESKAVECAISRPRETQRSSLWTIGLSLPHAGLLTIDEAIFANNAADIPHRG